MASASLGVQGSWLIEPLLAPASFSQWYVMYVSFIYWTFLNQPVVWVSTSTWIFPSTLTPISSPYPASHVPPRPGQTSPGYSIAHDMHCWALQNVGSSTLPGRFGASSISLISMTRPDTGTSCRFQPRFAPPWHRRGLMPVSGTWSTLQDVDVDFVLHMIMRCSRYTNSCARWMSKWTNVLLLLSGAEMDTHRYPK